MRLFVVALVGVALTACAPIRPLTPTSPRVERPNRPDPTLAEAVKYADSAWEAYWDYVTQEQLATRSGILGLTGLGSITAYRLLTGEANLNHLAALAVGGTGLYTASSLLISRPRQTLYAEAAKAISCSRDTVLTTAPPVHISDALREQINTFDSLYAKARGDAERTNIIQEAGSQRILIDAASARIEAEQARARIDRSAAVLVEAVNAIVDTVGKYSIQLEPDIGFARAEINNVLSAQRIPTLPPKAVGAATAGETKTAANSLTAKYGPGTQQNGANAVANRPTTAAEAAAAKELSDLQQSTELLRNAISSLPDVSAVRSPSQCMSGVQSQIVPLHVLSPSTIDLEYGKAVSLQLSAAGGRDSRTVHIDGNTAVLDVTLSFDANRTMLAVVKTKDGTTPAFPKKDDTYRVIFGDPDGQVIVTLQFTKAPT